MMMKEVPVLLLTGYLGSGKTTLVNHILSNEKGIKFAVVVNDIGEVNIDAELIQRGGVVGQGDDSLVALQNGCICCSLKMDLMKQIDDLMKMNRFDYIVIEASGVCEPAPIAQTIAAMSRMGSEYTKHGLVRLDCIVTVVDALRLQSEFNCGDALTSDQVDDEDIENLIIQQIEFCNIILLNKASEVAPEELKRITHIVKTLQPGAEIIPCDYADVELDKILNTRMFGFEQVATSAGWVRELERPATEEEEEAAHHPHTADEHHHHHDHDHEHEHEHDEECSCGHHHHHDHEDGECTCGHHHDHEHEEGCCCGHHHHHGSHTEEYGISTFVYYRRKAFDLVKFDHYVAAKWPASVIRAKGVCYFMQNRDMSYLFEQAGKQQSLKEAGLWYATAPEEDLAELLRQDPGMMRDWDEEYGDRMEKIVFIGQHMDKEQIIRDLDACLEP